MVLMRWISTSTGGQTAIVAVETSIEIASAFPFPLREDVARALSCPFLRHLQIVQQHMLQVPILMTTKKRSLLLLTQAISSLLDSARTFGACLTLRPQKQYYRSCGSCIVQRRYRN
ncbi:hypothetical protein KP509_21G070600 [Ceratopteris richardii]|uniref:Uncharacterized protein n=1 Tax=Ceratopteris richardii TaxID=49495 RepID=A0A8T2SE26_CERRI|nr:hypothetical protein KP509_21G070600 [Ceratopteris richardii]